MHTTAKLAAALGLSLYSLASFAACGSTACSANTNWDEHSPQQEGLSADFRFSYSKADVLRSGSKKINVNPTDPAFAPGQEVENKYTTNKILSATFDYTYNENWGSTLQIPFITRDHIHSLANTNPALVTTDSFHASSIGDIKIGGRYRWTLDEATHSSIGVKFGLKLNTGKRNFLLASGTLPNEVTLQPGNGSTDLVLGAFWQQAVPGSEWSWFAQGIAQSAIKSAANFRPGNQFNIDLGSRYAFTDTFSGMLQFNVQYNNADSGAGAALTPAGAVSSGGRVISLTPGLNYALGKESQLYALIQLPIYQYMNGEQLTAKYATTFGLRHHF